MTENPDSVPPCPCGEPATTTVEMDWGNGYKRSRMDFCDECANDIVLAVDGAAEILP